MFWFFWYLSQYMIAWRKIYSLRLELTKICGVNYIYIYIFNLIILLLKSTFIILEVYKSFTLSKSINELDLFLNALFMLTVFFIFNLLYSTGDNYSDYQVYFLVVDIFFAALILFTNIYTHIIVKWILLQIVLTLIN